MVCHWIDWHLKKDMKDFKLDETHRNIQLETTVEKKKLSKNKMRSGVVDSAVT